MASLFISYSRKDIEVAKKLTSSFNDQGLDFWIDWEGIPPAVDFWKEIEKGIEEADIFLFLLSPDSAKSKVCRQEIEHAAKNGKRLIPIVVRDIPADESPTELRSLNWIFIRENDDRDAGFNKLITAIKTDYEWVQAQRQLQVKALEWERNNHENSLLLRGKELENAEFQLITNSSKEPIPTDLQRSYVFSGRQATDRQRRITTSISIAGIVILAGLAVFGLVQARLATTNEKIAVANEATAVANEQEAKRQAKIARAGELAAQSLAVDQPFLSFLISAESFKRLENYPQRNSLLNSLQVSPSLITILHGYQASVWSVAFSPDRKTLATGTADGRINLWNVSNPTVPVQLGVLLNSHTDNVWSVAFSPNGKTLAAGTVDHSIVMWDISNLDTPSQLGVPFGSADDVRSVTFSPDGKTLASASCEKKDGGTCVRGEIILWDVSNLTEPVQLGIPLNGHTNDVQSVAFSPDGNTLASGSMDNTIILWDVSNPAEPMQLDEPLKSHKLPVLSVAFSPDGNTLASGSMDNTIILWDVSSPAEPMQLGEPLDGHADEVRSVAFSPDGNTLASGSADHKIIIWDTSNPKEPIQLGFTLAGHTNIVLSVTFSPDGKTLASGSVDRTVILWDVPNPAPPIRLSTPLRHTDYVWSVSFSPDGKTLAAGTIDHTIVLWDVSDPAKPNQLGEPLDRHAGAVWSVAFSPDGKTLASGGCGKFNGDICIQGEIILWDISNPIAPEQLSRPLTIHTNHVQSVTFSPDGKTLASGSWDNTIILWDVTNPAEPVQLSSDPPISYNGIVRSVTFSPDGKTLAFSGDDLTIELWDISNPAKPIQLSDLPIKHTNYIWSVAFSTDGKILASGSLDTTVILWDVTDPSAPFQLGEPLSHTDYVWSIAFSPDSKTLASTSCGKRDDNKNCIQGEISLWDVSRPAIPLLIGKPLSGHTNEVLSITFSPDSKILASGSLDNTVILWNVDPKSWAILACQKVGRNFTQTEWKKYFPDEEYSATCSQWPSEPESTATPNPTP